jgi:RNA polymerase sigma-70 factor (ECF subfamily)
MGTSLAADSGRPATSRAERLSPNLPIDDRIEPEDAEALARIAVGDSGALRVAFVRHWAAVARAALRVAGDFDDARDAAQEAFIRLYVRPPSVDTPLRAWLCRVATNEAVNALRSGRRRVAREGRHLAAVNAAATDEIAEANLSAERALVRETLLALSARSRDLLVLRAEGFRYFEIATALGVAPGSVGTLLVRAEQAFREGYEARRGGA